MAKDEINLQDFDFGFTAVDETELEAVTVASQQVAAASTDTKEMQNKTKRFPFFLMRLNYPYAG